MALRFWGEGSMWLVLWWWCMALSRPRPLVARGQGVVGYWGKDLRSYQGMDVTGLSLLSIREGRGYGSGTLLAGG